jgi:predicted metal-dependent hydrolase
MLPLLRKTLDLFDPRPPAQPLTPQPEIRQPVASQPLAPQPAIALPKAATPPPATLDATPSALRCGPRPPSTAGLPLADAIAPMPFAHPRANRSIRIADAQIAYAFVRSARRTIGLSIGPDGLSVRAPRWTPLHEVEAVVHKKGDWILRKLQDSRQRQERIAHECVDWRNGVVLPFLGQSMEVVLDPSHDFEGKGAQLQGQTLSTPCTLSTSSTPCLHPAQAAPLVLQVSLAHNARPEQIRDAVQAWLMQQALAHFQARMLHFAPLLQVRWSKLRLSSANTRWGSASSDGSIRLNWRLMHFRAEVIDYVVAHELSHLREMNHSPRFWDTVASVVPDYAQLRGQLKTQSAPKF